MTLPALDGYKINQQLASGGMAKIYDATQVSLNRPVAIKFLSRKLLSHSEATELFERESLIIAQLHHPNIVQVIDKGISQDSQPYFVMEKVNGIDLALMLSDGELPYGKKLDIAIQLCKGLAYAHKNGVIHRDIKPSNIIIDQHGDVKILDFGIALAKNESANKQGRSAVIGTEGYVAPEQEEDYGSATVASDIYSVGILFIDLFAKTATKDSNPPKNSLKRLNSDLPESLVKLIKKCSEPSPEKRFASLSEVRDQLLKISQGSHLGQTNVREAEKESNDLTKSFNLLDVLSKTKSKSVYLFQKKSNRQLLVIKRSFGDFSGLKEAKYLSSLKHPNIVNILAAARSEKCSTIICEYLSGGSLSNQLIQGLSEQKFLLQACQICSALYFAHQNNILHSNLGPNNILIDDKQNLKLTDFGQKSTSNDNPQLASTYQPPGQQAFSEQYDIYCMGAIFHHMLYGVPPGTPIPKVEQKVSFRLEKLIDKMLSMDPINRPASAQQVLVELQRIGSSANKRMRSRMGEPQDQELQKKKQRRRPRQVEESHSVYWLGLGLVISIVINLLLSLKIYLEL